MKINEGEMIAQARQKHEELIRWYEQTTREFGGVNKMGLPTYIDIMERFAEDPLTSGPTFGYGGEVYARRALFYREMQSRDFRQVQDVLSALGERKFEPTDVSQWIKNSMIQEFEKPWVRKGYPELASLLDI